MRNLLIIVGFLHVVHKLSELTSEFTVTKTVKEEPNPAAEKAAE